MKGADEYYDLFNGKSQQLGRLYIQCHVHARGKCFEIKLMPEGMIGSGDYVSGSDVVEVYGMTSGQRGWTETYGWIHHGKWVDGFNKIVEAEKNKRDARIKEKEKIASENAVQAQDRISSLLNDYV